MVGGVIYFCHILKTSLVPLECYFPGQIVRQDTDSVHSAITSVLRPFQHTAMLDHTQTQIHRHTNNIHQSILRTTVYHSQSRFTEIVIVIVRDKISRIFYVSDFIYKTKIYLRTLCGQSAGQRLMDWRVACHRRWDHHEPSSQFVKFSISLFCPQFYLCSVYFPIISDSSSDEFWFATNWAFLL